MNVQPFIVFCSKQRSTLEASLNKDLEEWASAWFCREISFNLVIESIRENFSDYKNFEVVKVWSASERGWAIFVSDPDKLQRIASAMMVGPEEDSHSGSEESILFEVARMAVFDLIQRFLRTGKEPEIEVRDQGKLGNCLPAEAFSPGREALCLKIECSGVSLLVWASMMAFLPRITSTSKVFTDGNNPVVNPREAVANQQLSAWVTLGFAELKVGALGNLKIGDVIRLDKDLQEPLSLVIEKSTASFSGYLGKQGDNLAFKIGSLSN